MSISSSHGPVTHELLLESTADQGKIRRSVKTKFCAFCKIFLPGIGKGARHIQDGKVGRKQASIRIDSIHDNDDAGPGAGGLGGGGASVMAVRTYACM